MIDVCASTKASFNIGGFFPFADTNEAIDVHCSPLAGRVILVTGGTGSWGQKFVEIALRHNPRAIRIFSRGELLQRDMALKFPDDRLRFFIGDVRDKQRVMRAMQGVDLVIHTAALKHVPIAAYNPREAVLTNVMGSLNVIEAALDCGVEKAIAISTDKAAAATTLYGATKAVMEQSWVQANVYAGGGNPKFSVVRYGNVFGSRGSAPLLFKEQANTGKITITDPRMTRFWISLTQGVEFVLSCLDRMAGGEIFVPKIPSGKVTDLADAIAPDTHKETMGIRPGEKLHEVLVTEDEARHTKDYPDRFVIEPEFQFWQADTLIGGCSVPEGFRYSSDTNSWMLTKEELKMMAELL